VKLNTATTAEGALIQQNSVSLPEQPLSICVTGGAGFLGSHLCDLLLSRGHSVIAVDNFHTGRAENLRHVESEPRFLLVEHDIVAPLPRSLPRFDRIYNLACPASPVHYQSDPLFTLAVCSTGIAHLLGRALEDGARFLQASTSEVYGDPEVHPQRETYWGNVNPIGPRACYDEGKRFAETLITEFARKRGVPVRLPRIFNTYGPRMRPDDGRVISNFVVQALRGQDITIFGDGTQTRSFCYVTDLVAGFELLMEANGDVGAPVNLGNPGEFTVGELAHMIISLTQSGSRIAYHPLPTDDPKRRRPSINLARRLLGWAPTVPLEHGLIETISHFAANRLGHSEPTAGPAVGLSAVGLHEPVPAPALFS
jgi:UDP-glucuronate decarboxylase